MQQRETGKQIYSAAALKDFTARLLIAHGLTEGDAETVADGLVLANLRGVDSHGIARLPSYCDRLRAGVVDPRPELRVTQVAAAAAHLDGGNGMGFVVGDRAMSEAIRLAGESGIGLVGVHRSNHFGMSAFYVLKAIKAGFISFVYTNSSPAMPVWGARSAFLGASPFAAGVPAGDGTPFVLDMACTVTARGKLKFAAQRGEPIAPGLALDSQGRPTTDGQAAFEGVVLPFGGAKGAALAMLMDLLCGVFTGAAFVGGVKNPFTGLSGEADVGHFFVAIRPDLFMPEPDYEDRMRRFVATAKAEPLAEGFDEILIPGEPEARTAALRKSEGIPVTDDVIEALRTEAAAVGEAMPVPGAPSPDAG